MFSLLYSAFQVSSFIVLTTERLIDYSEEILPIITCIIAQIILVISSIHFYISNDPNQSQTRKITLKLLSQRTFIIISLLSFLTFIDCCEKSRCYNINLIRILSIIPIHLLLLWSLLKIFWPNIHIFDEINPNRNLQINSQQALITMPFLIDRNHSQSQDTDTYIAVMPIHPNYETICKIHSRQIEKHCVICSNEMTPTSKLVLLTCGHYCHAICIQKWFFENNTCPFCRQVVIQRYVRLEIA